MIFRDVLRLVESLRTGLCFSDMKFHPSWCNLRRLLVPVLVWAGFAHGRLLGAGPEAVSIRLAASSGLSDVYVNGTARGLGADAGNWKKADDYGPVVDLRVVAVRCVNAAPNIAEAGFIGTIALADGRRVCTDALWKVYHPADGAAPPADAEGRQWYEEEYDDRAWADATSDGAYGIPPWGTDQHPPIKKQLEGWPPGEAPELDAAMREMAGGVVQWNAEWIWCGNASYAVSPVYFRRTFVPTAANGAQVPTAPGRFAVNAVTATGAELSWTPSFAPGGVAGYHVYWNGLRVATTTATRETVSGLTINSTAQNYFYVRAFDARGQESAPTAFVVARLTGQGKLKAPTNVRITARYQDGFEVDWDAPDDGVSADSYLVDVKCAGGGSVFYCPGSVTHTACRYPGIHPGTPCTITVRAEDADLKSSDTSLPAVRSTLPAGGDAVPPGVPVNARISARTDHSITLTWADSADGIPVAGYRVYKNGLPIATTPTSPFTVAGTGAGERGYFAVQAFDANANESAVSDPVPFREGGGNPAPPVLSDAGRTDCTVVLRWDRIDPGLCTSFTLRRWDGGDATGTSVDATILDPYATSREITDLSPGATYCFVLVANGVNGVGVPSKPLTLTTVSPPTTPPLLRIGSAYLPSGNPTQLRRVVVDAAARGCDFLAIGGNHVEQDNGTDEQWDGYMDTINAHRGAMPVYLTPQSHDTQPPVYDPKVGTELFFDAKYNRFTQKTGFGLSYAVSRGPVRLISAASLGAGLAEPLLARTQLFLQEQLSAADADPGVRWVFVAGGDGQGGAFEHNNWRYPMLQTSRPVIFLSQAINGNPGYQLTWQPGMNYFTTSAQSTRFGGGNYQIIHVYADRLVFQQRAYDTAAGAWTTGRWYEVLYDRATNLLDPGQVRQTIVGGSVVGKPAPAVCTEAPWAQNLFLKHDGDPVPVRLLGRSPRAAALTYAVVTPPTHGRLTGEPPDLTYHPEAGYAGEDVFVYRVNDGSPATSNHAYCRIEGVNRERTRPEPVAR